MTDFFPPSSFDHLVDVESGHWWFRSRNRILLWVLKKRVARINSFLEIGCGTGFVIQAIQEHYPQTVLCGSDYFEEGLVHARKRMPSINFTQQDARKMDEEELYDVIGAFDVIEHINEDELVLSNLSHALKSRGTLLVTVPQHRWLWSAVDEYSGHVRRYTRSELIGKVTKSGLTVNYVTSFVSLLVPVMWFNRLRASRANYNPMDEFRISSWLNKLLEIIMFIELGLIKIGIKLPFGGSLLLLASKKK